MYRIHLLGLAHTKTNKDFSLCAYTQKIYKMGKMMTDLGHQVFHYGAEGSDLQCTENIEIISTAEQDYAYEDHNWRKDVFTFSATDDAYKLFIPRAIEEIKKRLKPGDFLFCPMGHLHKIIADALPLAAVEMGIGYTGIFAKYKVFESYSWMHYIYGYKFPNSTGADGNNYDVVIPNFYDVNDFEYSDKKDDYILYLGRLVPRKGVLIAYQVAQHLNMRLVIAGWGDLGKVNIPSDKVEFVGMADPAKRKQLLKNAKVVMVPTLYLEPFGGVNVEAMLSGTPVVTSDWGGFVETVVHGKTGYRCRTFDDYVWAVKNIENINSKDCFEYASKNYSLERVGKMYEEYLLKLSDLRGKGWYTEHPERKELSWLEKYK